MRKYLCFLFSTILVLLMTSCHSFGTPMTYIEARSSTVEFFNKHKEDFLAVVAKIKENPSSDVSIKGIDSIWCDDEDANTTITFYKQGYGLMTGGQYWGIYYTSNDNPYNNWGVELVSGPYEGCFYWQEEGGGNTYVTERLEDGWYFYYEDYDGNGHGLDWEFIKRM